MCAGCIGAFAGVAPAQQGGSARGGAEPLQDADRSIADDLDIADRYWGPHACAGRVEVTLDPTLGRRARLGEATGLVPVWNGSDFDWRVERCAISVLPDLEGQRRCAIIVHEVGHLIHGPDHDGPLSDAALSSAWEACRVRRSLRASLVTAIRADLPFPQGSWRVWCSRTRPRMACWAHRPGVALRRFDVRPARLGGEFEGTITRRLGSE